MKQTYNIQCFVQFGKMYDIDIEATCKKEALNKLEQTIKNIGYQYCPGDEIIIDIDNCEETVFT